MAVIERSVSFRHICQVINLLSFTPMTFDSSAHLLSFVLPMSFKKGDITFISPMTGVDVHIPITPGQRPRQVVSTDQLGKGVWRALLHWSDGRQQYQDEKQIIVT